MAISVGERVPDFDTIDHNGNRKPFSAYLADGPVVLFFYPKAHTGGCTAEACHFRDLAAEFDEVGAQRIGVSRDDVDNQRSFADKHGFDYPLLSDEDGSIAKVFGAKRVGPMWSKRNTYVIGSDGSLLHEVRSESNMEQHADEALAFLRTHVNAR